MQFIVLLIRYVTTKDIEYFGHPNHIFILHCLGSCVNVATLANELLEVICQKKLKAILFSSFHQT